MKIQGGDDLKGGLKKFRGGGTLDEAMLEGLPRLFPLQLSLKTFFGVTRALVEQLGAEKPLIATFAQMVP